MKIWIILLALIFIPPVYAINVTLIIQSYDKPEIFNLNLSEGSTAKDALIATGLETKWSYGGAFLDCISGVCGQGMGKWWCFTYKRGDVWKFSNVGLASYICEDGDIIGLRFVEGESSEKCFSCLLGKCSQEVVEHYCAPNFQLRPEIRKSKSVWMILSFSAVPLILLFMIKYFIKK